MSLVVVFRSLRVALALGSISLVGACGGSGRSGPNPSSTATATTPIVGVVTASVPSAADTQVATATTPDPVEAWHDATLVPDEDAGKLQKLEVLLHPWMHDAMAFPYRNVTYLSNDGSTAIVFEPVRTTPDDDHNMEETILRIRVLDRPSDDKDIVFLDGPPCRLPDMSECPRPKAHEQVKEINKFLAKHLWTELDHYRPWLPKDTSFKCGAENLARNFRVLGYDVTFREPALRIVRQKDAAVVLDRSDARVSRRVCPEPPRTFIGSVAIDAKRRAGVAALYTCYSDCGNGATFFFFRLPKQTP